MFHYDAPQRQSGAANISHYNEVVPIRQSRLDGKSKAMAWVEE